MDIKLALHRMEDPKTVLQINKDYRVIWIIQILISHLILWAIAICLFKSNYRKKNMRNQVKEDKTITCLQLKVKQIWQIIILQSFRAVGIPITNFCWWVAITTSPKMTLIWIILLRKQMIKDKMGSQILKQGRTFIITSRLGLEVGLVMTILLIMMLILWKNKMMI